MTLPIANTDIRVIPGPISDFQGGDSSASFIKSEFFSEIVAAATFAPPGVEIQTLLKCRKRPDRRPCSGQILARLEENPAQLHWWCNECGEKGVIRNWKGTPGFVVHTKKDLSIDRTLFELVLSIEEFTLLSEIAIIEPSASRAVKEASRIESGLMISGTIATFDAIMGYIAFEANHSTKRGKRIALNKLLNRIEEQIKQSFGNS